jgi:prepilin signal peptidase PulO-like enzyme (type II secretory pathway)
MALTSKCRVCGAVIPGRYPIFVLTWLLALATFIMILIIPSLIGFATVAGGLAVVIGVFVGLVAVLLYLRSADSCESCKMQEK